MGDARGSRRGGSCRAGRGSLGKGAPPDRARPPARCASAAAPPRFPPAAAAAPGGVSSSAARSPGARALRRRTCARSFSSGAPSASPRALKDASSSLSGGQCCVWGAGAPPDAPVHPRVRLGTARARLAAVQRAQAVAAQREPRQRWQQPQRRIRGGEPAGKCRVFERVRTRSIGACEGDAAPTAGHCKGAQPRPARGGCRGVNRGGRAGACWHKLTMLYRQNVYFACATSAYSIAFLKTQL